MQQWLVELIVSWLPFIILMGIWVWIGRRGALGPGAKVAQLYEQQINETRRTNVLLERIAVSLEKQRMPQ